MDNYSLRVLENCKNGLIETIESYSTKGEFNYNWCLSNEDYQEARKILMKMYAEMRVNVHEAITKCRNVKEFIHYLQGIAYMGNYSPMDVQLEISEMFNPVMDFIEDKNIEVKLIYIKCDVPKELTYEHILEDLRQCDKRIENGDYPGAITRARRLIEGAFKEIIFNITGEEVNGNEKLPALLKKVQRCLNLDAANEKLAEPLKQVISGLVNVVNGLTTIRNKVGDAHSNNSNLRLHHALLVVNSAKTLVAFLFDTYDYQRERNILVVKK
ncbi:abortive infection family protein [Bacillus cereus]|uniref:abortive infection family protein n=1 Tax=Bacillus cereus TaxID=1396 RepID=UPI0018F2F82C|nr:abortive infection family protein [Bacillus cereus]MBJ8089194.1 abortive infection family protein [Bacillus cereus]